MKLAITIINLERSNLTKVWTYWEFDHPTGTTVRVISTKKGLELFAQDVFRIVAPELNNENVVLLNIEAQERYVIIDEQLVEIKTLTSVAIYNLIGIVEKATIEGFTQWVRSKILPIFYKDFL